MSDSEIVFRPWLVTRIYVVAFGTVWCSFLAAATFTMIRDDQGLAALLPLAMFVLGAVLSSSLVRIRVVTNGDELRVRNFLTEKRFHRHEIDRFIEHSVNGMPFAFGGQVAVLLTNDQLVELRATQNGPFGRSRRQARLRRLRNWHTRPT